MHFDILSLLCVCGSVEIARRPSKTLFNIGKYSGLFTFEPNCELYLQRHAPK